MKFICKCISIILIISSITSAVSFSEEQGKAIVIHAWASTTQVFNDSEFDLTLGLRRENGSDVYYDPNIKCNLFLPDNMIVLKEDKLPNQNGEYNFRIWTSSSEANDSIIAVFHPRNELPFGRSMQLRVINTSPIDRFINDTYEPAWWIGLISSFVIIGARAAGGVHGHEEPIGVETILPIALFIYGTASAAYIGFVRSPQWGISFERQEEGSWNRIKLNMLTSEEVTCYEGLK